MPQLIILIISCFLNGLLGLVVYSKNPRSATNRLFALLTVTFIVWSTVNYMSVHPALLPLLMWIRLVLFCAAPLCLLVFLTFTVFPAQQLEGSSAVRKSAVFGTVLVMCLTLTPLVFKGLTHTTSRPNPIPNFGIALFVLLVGALLGGGIWNLVSKYRHSVGNIKLQLRFVLLGLAGTFGLILVTILVPVLAFHNNTFVPFASAYTLIFTGSFAYAIIKHRLFDIRRAAARGLAYVLTVVTLAILYISIVFGISSVLLKADQPDHRAQIVYTVIAVVLAVSFQRIKEFFDRISNSIFFRNSYNPQQFLNELNRVLVTQVELQHILANSTSIIERNLKSESCLFAISKTAYFPIRIIGDGGHSFDERDIEQLRPLMIRTHAKVIVADYLEEKDAELRTQLNDKNMAVVIRLIPSLAHKTEGVGEIVLGPKRNGEPYTPADSQVLEILANELVIAIQNALRFEEIQNFNMTLQARINDATRKLRHANERLKALDETKDDFISMASHQLRTPLTSIKGYLSMVLEGDAGKVSKMERDMLGQAFFSSQRMVYLIADLLNVSRLKTGKFIIEQGRVNLATMVDQEIGQLKETAASRNLTLTYDKPKDFPDMQLDETKTRQVVMNFVDNAIYYTPAGGYINVRLVNNPSTIELRVEDNGIGVAKSDQPHLFTKFYRAGNARKARPDGTGLGLFMAKKVIIAEGGSIIFESEPGKGSTFGFVFSKSKTAVPASGATH